MRGFEPEVYVVAQRRFAGRFFWTVALTDPQRMFKRSEWLAEDKSVLVRASPHYVVVLADGQAPLESLSYFAPDGYQRVTSFGRLIVLEKSK